MCAGHTEQPSTDSILVCNSARTLAATVLGERHPIIAAYCSQLGELYKACGALDKAVQMHERALVLLDAEGRADTGAAEAQAAAAAASEAGAGGGDAVAWLASASALATSCDVPLREAIARSYFSLADALACGGRVESAFEMSIKVPR